ncbi:hypothetical protein F5Y18DRAFT_427088 [Xylariaceae sp. FL1019]|nr:hypothetical protein F5Y18DRAFT_427088 [Xylariaceae sp. FL1019]
MPPAHSSSRRHSRNPTEFEGTIRTRRNSVTIEFPSGFRVIAESCNDSRPAQSFPASSPPPRSQSSLGRPSSRMSEQGSHRRSSRRSTPEPFGAGSVDAVFVAAGYTSFPLELPSRHGFVEDSSISHDSNDSQSSGGRPAYNVASRSAEPPASGLRGGIGEQRPSGDNNRRNPHPNGQSFLNGNSSSDENWERIIRHSRCPLLRLLFGRRQRYNCNDNHDRYHNGHRRDR